MIQRAQYNDQQLESFKLQFARRRARLILIMAPILLSIILIRFIVNPEDKTVLGFIPFMWVVWPMAVGVIAMWVFAVRLWRCPACNKFLWSGWNPSSCSKCGIPLS